MTKYVFKALNQVRILLDLYNVKYEMTYNSIFVSLNSLQRLEYYNDPVSETGMTVYLRTLKSSNGVLSVSDNTKTFEEVGLQ